VALTALAMEGDQERALAAGCDGYITKPIDTRTLGDSIRGYLSDGKSQADGNRAPAADPFADAGMDDLKRQFLDEALQQVPLWIEELDSQFDPDHAREVAHQWVGSGGLLGFREVSLLAREAETILRQKPLDIGELRSTFEALLTELQNPTPRQPAAPVAAPPTVSAERPRVVLAAEDSNMRALIKALLDNQDVECVTAADGRAALDLIRQTKPRAVVLDDSINGMSADEVVSALRAEGIETKLVLIRRDEHPGNASVSQVLVKPLDPLELVVRVKKLLEQRGRGGRQTAPRERTS